MLTNRTTQSGAVRRRKAGELQIQIDDVYACLGQCAGCVLAPEERKAQSADMTEETLALAVGKLREHAAAVGPLNRINVTFGIADHLLIGVDYLEKLHALGSSIVEAGRPADRAHSAVFFTTSLVGKPASVIAMLREVRARMRGSVPLIPLVVLDGRLIKSMKFGPMWREMVLVAKELFGKVDLSTNLSGDAVSCMSPQELASFATRNGFDEVTVNWAPTIRNAASTLDDVAAVTTWLLEFDRLAERKHAITTSFRPVIARTIDAIMCRDGSAPSLIGAVEGIVPETIRKSIEIDHLGFVLPKLEAIGDITHADRHGLKALGHLSDGTVEEIIERAMPRVLSKIIGIHAQGACSTCRHTAVCAGTGFHVATHVARKTGRSQAFDEEACPHVAYALIDAIASQMRAQDEAMDRGPLFRATA
ncbi:hypothetical protein [Rhizobium leguminosarum]|uniref:hypothetical protein n=1 Tax=Rhizobium leguminosarum TaxID=384 RepID=UPI002E0F02A5|nr:hypothetical protein U8Q02_36235 [Rhizobium leguminosarum]